MGRGKGLLPRRPVGGLARVRMKHGHLGTQRSEEAKAKISAALKGRQLSPEARQRQLDGITKYRKTQALEKLKESRMPDETYWATVRKKASDRRKQLRRDRVAQWEIDKMIAKTISEELYEDVRRSCGYYMRRLMHDPRISDGYYQKFGKTMWRSPRVRKLREAAKKVY